MIQDQHKNILLNYYEDLVNKAVNYIKTKYILVECNRDDSDIPENIRSDGQSYRFFKIKTELLSRSFIIVLALPIFFPDVFPRICLSKKNYEEIYPIPHLDKNRFICTRDPEVVALNDKKPGETVEELIKIALEILEKGIKRENTGEFIEEFLAYWNDEASCYLLSIFEPVDYCKRLYLFALSKRIFYSKNILSDSKEKLKKWLDPFDIEIEDEFYNVLYIPLSEFNPYLLDKNKDLLAILNNDSFNKKNIKNVANFFNESSRNKIIISSIDVNNEKMLFGWRHQIVGVKQFKGFRGNCVPLQIRLLDSRINNKSIEKIELMRLDKRRIFRRGGAITSFFKKDNTVGLIGCGSLGSYLAMSLAKCSVSRFILIDKENLSPENTPRHLCGFLEASLNMKKVDAVKKRLKEHFPHLECETYSDDFLKLFYERKIDLEKCDLLVIAIGNISIERRINFLQRKGEINCPIAYIWIEPFGVGGHILYIDTGEHGCYNCCFENNGVFKYSISKPDKEFQKRESGCQSTFIPYSSLQIEQFISIAGKKIIEILIGKLKRSMLFTWVGDIEGFEDMNFKTNRMYATKSPYSVIETNILSQESCEVCGEKKINL